MSIKELTKAEFVERAIERLNVPDDENRLTLAEDDCEEPPDWFLREHDEAEQATLLLSDEGDRSYGDW